MSSMRKKIGITGGSGFIGRYLTELLESTSGYQIENLDLEEPKFESSASLVKGDVRSTEFTDQLCAGADCIVHLAAAHRDTGIEREEYFDVNETGTKVLLESMARGNVHRLVFYSSVAVYDPATKGVITDATEPNPQNHYGASKLAAEKAVEEWIKQDDRRSALIVRPTVVIGARNVANMYSLIDQINRGRYKFNFGSGKNIKSLAIVMNLVEFTLWAMETQLVKPGSIKTFNYIDYPQLHVHKTIEIIHEELGRRMPKVAVPMPLAVTGGVAFDVLAKIIRKPLPISSARIKKLATTTQFEAENVRATSFDPRFTTEDGLRQMVVWFRQSNGGSEETQFEWLGEAQAK